MDLSNAEERWESARRDIQQMLNKYTTTAAWTGRLVKNTEHSYASYSMLDVNVHDTLHDTLHKCVTPLRRCMTKGPRRSFHFSFEPVSEEHCSTSEQSFVAFVNKSADMIGNPCFPSGPVWL